MARQEKPVDPTAGPLQQFAYDLRKVRKEAGDPTYRALAKTAGYSASTLSEAVGGTRMPTMEVVLAYVGACGGDVEAWRDRWLALNQQVGTGTRVPPPPPEPQTNDPPSTGAESATPDTQRTKPRRVMLVAAGAAATLLAAGAALPRLWATPDQDSADPPVVTCPPRPADAKFVGTTYGGGAHVRSSGATRDEPIVRTIPANCQIGLRGLCIGEKVYDSTSGTPDVRWFLVSDGVISSAVIHGNPPRSLGPATCPRGRPAPNTLRFSITKDHTKAGTLRLQAEGPNVDIVGFAVTTGLDASTRKWRQVGFADVTTAAVGAHTTLAGLSSSRSSGPTLVLAAACLGGDGPTDILQVRQIDAATPEQITTAHIDGAELATAARSACQYPRRG